MEELRIGTLTVVMPAYNEEDNIIPAVRKIRDVLQKEGIEYELLFVDDGSTDRTWHKIEAASKEDSRVSGLHFSRNFVKESAICAGLANVKTECCAVMDCDLQHPAETLPEMYALWQTGADIVEGVKTSRGEETKAHRGAASLFYRIMTKAAGFDMEAASDYKLLDKEVLTVLRHMPERSTFFRAMSYWVGFETEKVYYEVQERTAGESKWSTRQLIKYALHNVATFTTAPMQLVTILGGIMMAVGFIFGLIALIQKICGKALGGFTTVIFLQIFIGAVLMLSIGIIGFYIARIYAEVQHRPRFIVSRACGDAKDETVTTG